MSPFEKGEHVVTLVVTLLVSHCTESESGGGMIDAALTNSMLQDTHREYLARTIESKAVEPVGVSVVEQAHLHDVYVEPTPASVDGGIDLNSSHAPWDPPSTTGKAPAPVPHSIRRVPCRPLAARTGSTKHA